MLEPGARVGEYEILAPLRSGGMAALYLARRAGALGFTKPVAIKVIHPHLASDPSFVEMFLDEARLSARIEDPNVVHVEDLGEADGMLYLAMEYVLGAPLSALMAKLVQASQTIDVPVCCAIAMRVADGLHAAHELHGDDGASLEVVHRDVSPQNVLLSEAGHVKLIDFGVARARGRLSETEAGALKGKVRYMSPEQAWAKPIDRRTDVYALGIVLWEMLVQRRFIEGDNDIEALELARAPTLVRPSTLRAGVPKDLDDVILTALEREPSRRFASAQAFRRAISNAVPASLRVEPGEIAALLESHFARQLENERRLVSGRTTVPPRTSAPSDPGRAEPRSEPSGSEPSRSEEATRAASRSRKSLGPAPTGDAPRSSSVPTAAALPSPGEREPSPTPSAPGASSPSIPEAAALPSQTTTPARSHGVAPVVWLAIGAVALVGVATLSFAAGWIMPSGAPTTETPAAAGPTPSVEPDPCGAITPVVARMNETVHVALDTTSAESLFTLPGVRSPEGEPAPDAVIEIRVPGDARTTVEVSTANAGTDASFDTILAAFEGACGRSVASQRPMFSADDHGHDRRARGAFAVRGGSVVTLVVSGFGHALAGATDRGRVDLEIAAHPAAPPVLDTVAATLAGDSVFFEVTGQDVDLDADRARIELLDASDRAVMTIARGERVELPLHEVLLPLQTDARVHGTSRWLAASNELEPLTRVTQVELSLVDRAGNVTAPRRVPITRGDLVGPGEVCDETHRCATELSCGGDGRCAASSERRLACGQVNEIVLDASAPSQRILRTLPAGYALFEASCAEVWARGREDVHALTIPDGRWDLVLVTEPAELRSAPADMVLAVRKDCLDPRPPSAPAEGCSDDRSAESRRPRVELNDVAPGSRWYVLASAVRPDPRFETGGLDYTLGARLRAVRVRGEACDAEGHVARCANGACVDGRCRE